MTTHHKGIVQIRDGRCSPYGYAVSDGELIKARPFPDPQAVIGPSQTINRWAPEESQVSIQRQGVQHNTEFLLVPVYLPVVIVDFIGSDSAQKRGMHGEMQMGDKRAQPQGKVRVHRKPSGLAISLLPHDSSIVVEVIPSFLFQRVGGCEKTDQRKTVILIVSSPLIPWPCSVGINVAALTVKGAAPFQ